MDDDGKIEEYWNQHKELNKSDLIQNLQNTLKCSKQYIDFKVSILESNWELDGLINDADIMYKKEFQNMLEKRVYNLTKKTFSEQGSEAWLRERDKCISASDAGTSLGLNKYEERYDLVLKKCGKGKAFTGNKFTDHGHKYEDVAAQLYQTMNLVPLKFFGLIVHNDPSIPIGASPDGIREDGVMLEIKVPMTRQIVPGVVPPHYEVQTQVQMEVCNLWENDFYETRIIEYDFKDDYYADSNENDRISKDGCYKGMIGQFYHISTGKNTYINPPMWCTSKEMEKWIEQTKPNHLKANPELRYDCIIYWKQTIESCVHVKRDYKRMHEQYVPEFRKIWKEIEHHRSNGGIELVTNERDHDEDIEIKDVKNVKINFDAFADDSD